MTPPETFPKWAIERAIRHRNPTCAEMNDTVSLQREYDFFMAGEEEAKKTGVEFFWRDYLAEITLIISVHNEALQQDSTVSAQRVAEAREQGIDTCIRLVTKYPNCSGHVLEEIFRCHKLSTSPQEPSK